MSTLRTRRSVPNGRSAGQSPRHGMGSPCSRYDKTQPATASRRLAIACSGVSPHEAAPGRFNVFSWRGATLIADYGHNTDAMRALVQATASMPAERRVVVISGAGDRRDEDIRRQTEILGEAFDHVVLYQDQCQRGRADGEVLALLRQQSTLD